MKSVLFRCCLGMPYMYHVCHKKRNEHHEKTKNKNKTTATHQHEKMMRSSTAMVGRRMATPAAAATSTALVPVMANAQRTDLTFFTYYWWPSWAMGIWYPLATIWPVVIADIVRPSAAASKLPILHAFYEKRVDMKLRAAMDSTITQWENDVEASTIDSAISRTF